MIYRLDNIQSSNVDEVSYDTVTNLLTVKFNNGRVYNYRNVPVEVYHQIEDENNNIGGSVGKLLRAVVFSKADLYPYEDITEQLETLTNNGSDVS